MKLTDITTGVRLDLEVFNSFGDKIEPTFVSQFERADNEERAFIAAPIHEGVVYPVHIGAYMNVFFLGKDDLYKFRAVVQGRTVKDNIAMLKIVKKGDIEKIQRRQFFRFDCSVPVKYRVVEPHNSEKNVDAEFLKSITRDLSGGGMCILVEDKVEMGSLVECELLMDEKRPVKVQGKVTRLTRRNPEEKYKYEIGMNFKKIEYRDREAIIGFIFEEQRKLRKKGLI